MKLQLLPSSFDEDGKASAKQHLSCFVIDDRVAIDAGSLAMAASEIQQAQVRDIVLTHAHLDHIAGLPLFVDDLFSSLTSPVNVHATEQVIEVLERDVFNWSVYPKFSDLDNGTTKVLNYVPFENGIDFQVSHLKFRSFDVNHKVPSTGFVVEDENSAIAFTGDTAGLDGFWSEMSPERKLSALFIECAFPDELKDLAAASHHLTPATLKQEIAKFQIKDCPVFVINLKPMYRERIIRELAVLHMTRVEILEIGKIYEF